jgi:ArsR family transcriptional regulator, arsenate/arsenite/antimonite-responsive transcriptional repressor
MRTLCRALAHDHRLLIATLLKRHPELSSTELQVALGTAQATISHHLKILHEAGLILATPDGKWTRYRIDHRYERLIP